MRKILAFLIILAVGVAMAMADHVVKMTYVKRYQLLVTNKADPDAPYFSVYVEVQRSWAKNGTNNDGTTCVDCITWPETKFLQVKVPVNDLPNWKAYVNQAIVGTPTPTPETVQITPQ